MDCFSAVDVVKLTSFAVVQDLESLLRTPSWIIMKLEQHAGYIAPHIRNTTGNPTYFMLSDWSSLSNKKVNEIQRSMRF
jgi:hypothetical protein